MIVSEVNAVVSLLEKATQFTAQLHDGWYKGSAEVDAFQDKVLMLSAKHAQWSEQLRRHGISDDKHLLRVVELAEDALEKQQASVLKLQKSPFRRWRKKVFPTQLSYFFDKVLEIVDAGPQLLATRVANNDLLERYLEQTPATLPFGQDPNYVPIVPSIVEVQKALEQQEGCRVVTIYGGPGMGKSSMAKYLAVHYQEEKKRLGVGASFPDGVYYLFCGQGAGSRVRQLQLGLLDSLGFGIRSTIPNDSASSSGVQKEDYFPLPSPQLKLRSRLAEQELLIILDDIWEEKLLHEIIVPAKGVKYLLTSQMRDVYVTGEKIQIRAPSLGEARQIMANYTDGLPQKGEFPHNIQRMTDNIIGMLEHHPLSLANIGISINSSRATETSQWESIQKHVYAHLDENGARSPPTYDRPYSLPVSASMLFMVESLPVDAQRLLFLVALLEGQNLPEPLVKFFYRLIQTNKVLLKYNNHQRFLEDKSLINFTMRESRPTLGTHSLRTHYIRERKNVELRSMGSQILAASGDQGAGQLIKRGGTEQTLVTVLSALYYDRSFKDIVEGTFQNHIKVINNGVIPRNLSIDSDTLDLVESARKQCKQDIGDLVWLLNVDREEVTSNQIWKQRAHEYAKKIIIKFVCQGKLDDDCMASLLQLPQTTSTACATLRVMFHCHQKEFHYRNINLSTAYGETMRTLLDIFQDNTLSVERRATVLASLFLIFDYESKDTMLHFAETYEEAIKYNSNLEHTVIQTLWKTRHANSGRGIHTMVEISELLESLLETVVSENDHKLRQSAGFHIYGLSRYRHIALRIADFADALKTFFTWFSSEHMFLSDDLLGKIGEYVLCQLSIVPENRVKIRAMPGIFEVFGDIFTRLEEAWRTSDEDDRRVERRGSRAAGLLGHLALEKNFKETIASLPGVRESLLLLQLIEMSRCQSEKSPSGVGVFFHFYESTRALTLLYPNATDLIDIPSLGDIFQVFLGYDRVLPSDAVTASEVDMSYFSLYWTRVVACIQMGSYPAALTNLDRAHHHLELIQQLGVWDLLACKISSLGIKTMACFAIAVEELRDCRVFLQAMVEDYAGALLGADARVAQAEKWPGSEVALIALAERGVLKRLSGDLQGALDDLNAVAMGETLEKTMDPFDPLYLEDIIWNRGYVKFLMDDKTGAKNDAECAQQLKLTNFSSPINDVRFDQGRHLWQLRKIPICYLGLSL